ncbi:YqgE/AlgH family protein [Acidiferrimicrobium sp. IK]|uniref:YqgE/AlgH family protein n=1 Tax=Acidiferrimicrobium sp. IK TaxID=2871700 RepID=UPI0021CB5924|nr:YqgE/AlgH family protein [Acidiferrimicrobium sp. IK]MCU4183609.1 YqgE/AlgH family protein [Acidiferrimicrobium sp. IK]
MAALTRGCLLVANPLLSDANFDRTVVLLLARDADGAIGVVLNRPSPTGLDEVLPEWETLANSPPVLFVGGPVNQEAVICVARIDGGVPAGASSDGEGWSPVTGDLGTLDLDLDPDSVAEGLQDVRMFAGYAGWGPGQLESELAAEAWWVVAADRDDPFAPHPERLWTDVLRRQRGPLQVVSSYPDDPTAN